VAITSGTTPRHEGQRGHHDRTEAQACRFERRLDRAHALFLLLCRELDDQDGVLRRQPDQHDQPDLEVDVVGHAAHPHRQQAPSMAKGTAMITASGSDQLFVLRGQDQEDHDDAEAEGETEALPVRFSWKAWPVHSGCSRAAARARDRFDDGRWLRPNCSPARHCPAPWRR
jgi:hypothetical protein